MRKSYKPIIGWEKEYGISTKGRVWSFRRGRELKERIGEDGYKCITLCVRYRIKGLRISRLLYETYVGEIPKGSQINHIDGNKLNNNLENLEVVTPRENTRHAWKMGLCKKRLGSKASIAKLKEEDIPKIFKLRKGGMKQKDIASIFGLDQSNVSYILNKKTWKHA